MNRVSTPNFRVAFMALLLLVLMSAQGCSLFDKKEIIPPAQEQEKVLDKRTGTIQMQLDAQTKKVTYVLSTENGESITLESIAINLDRYTGRKVEVQGIYESRELKMQVEDVTTLSDELSVKKDYMNGAMGLSLQYPQNWLVDELHVGEGELDIVPYNLPSEERVGIDMMSVKRMDNPLKRTPAEMLTLDEFFRPMPPKVAEAGVVYQESLIGKKQYSAVKETKSNPRVVSFYVQRDTHMYMFGFYSANTTDTTKNENAFYELVNSFDFIPFNSNSIGISTPSVALPTTNPPASIAIGEPNPATPAQGEEGYKSFNYVAYQRDLNREKLLPAGYSAQDYTEIAYEYTLEADNMTPNGVYVTYTNEKPIRVYYVYTDLKNTASAVYKARFDQVDGVWVLKDGVNSGKGKAILRTWPEENAQKILIKAGMQLIQSKRLKADFQVPGSWYWGLTPEGYAFDSKPLSTREPIAVLSNELKAPEDAAIKTTESGFAYSMGVAPDGKNILCSNVSTSTFCIRFTDSALVSAMLGILESISPYDKM